MEAKLTMKKLLQGRKDKELYAELPESFPMELFNEEHAQKIHGQSLARLNERGGLRPVEMMLNIKRLSWKEFQEYIRVTPPSIIINELKEILNKHNG